MNSGFVDVKPLETSSGEVARENLSNTFPPYTDEGKFNSLQVGVGNYVFHVTDQGMWLGAEKFEDAIFSVTMAGVATVGGGGSIEGALYVGDAANDINTHTTTINGGKITTGSITADQIGVGAIVASKIASGAIISEKIAANAIQAVNIAAGVIAANHIATKTITGTLMADGTISALQIANATITGANIASSTISGGNIAGATITGGNIAGATITGNNIAASTITANKLSVTSLSAITATLGSVSSGTITSSTIVVPNESGGSVGYLRWSGGSRIWNDSANYMGYRALGGYHYFYGNGVTIATLTSAGQASFQYGVRSVGNFNCEANGATSGYFNIGGNSTISGRIYVSNYSYFYGGLYLTGISQMNCHVNTAPASYNFGGSSSYWNYVNAHGFSTHSMTSFDSPVLMPTGETLDDIGALKAIKERPEITDSTTGRVLLDKRSFPVDVVMKAVDNEGKEYARDKNNDPLIPNDKGILKPRPDADAVDLVQFTSLLFGGFKQLVKRVEELEKKLN